MTTEDRVALTLRCVKGCDVATVVATAAGYVLRIKAQSVAKPHGQGFRHAGSPTSSLPFPLEGDDNYLARCRCRVDNMLSTADAANAISRGERQLLVARFG